MFSRWKKLFSSSEPVEKPTPVEPPARLSSEMLSRRYVAEERTRWVELYKQSSLTVREFAEANGLKFSTFKGWVYGRPRPKPSGGRRLKRYTPDERRAAVEAFVKSGRKRRDFALLWSCSPESQDKWLERYREEGPRGWRRGRTPGGDASTTRSASRRRCAT